SLWQVPFFCCFVSYSAEEIKNRAYFCDFLFLKVSISNFRCLFTLFESYNLFLPCCIYLLYVVGYTIGAQVGRHLSKYNMFLKFFLVTKRKNVVFLIKKICKFGKKKHVV